MTDEMKMTASAQDRLEMLRVERDKFHDEVVSLKGELRNALRNRGEAEYYLVRADDDQWYIARPVVDMLGDEYSIGWATREGSMLCVDEHPQVVRLPE